MIPSTNSFDPYLPWSLLLRTPRPGILLILIAPGDNLARAVASSSTTCPDFLSTLYNSSKLRLVNTSPTISAVVVNTWFLKLLPSPNNFWIAEGNSSPLFKNL